MKIDQEYLKGLLEAFESAVNPTTDIKELSAAGFPYQTDEFVFHMRLLEDRGLIEGLGSGSGFGYTQTRATYSWAVVPLRLTADGHDFIEALKQKEVWQTIKTDFKDASLATMVSAARSLAEGFAKKKVKDITGIDL